MNEYHLTQYNNGHEHSTDCWCEPKAKLYVAADGEAILICVHSDHSPAKRQDVEKHRRLNPTWVDEIIRTL